MLHPHPRPTLFPYTTLFRSILARRRGAIDQHARLVGERGGRRRRARAVEQRERHELEQRVRRAAQERHELRGRRERSEEHTSELQSRRDLVCRLLLEKKKEN